MRKFYSLLAVMALLFVTSCSVLEHDEKGMVFIQLSGDAILARLNAQHSSRGVDLKPSVKYKADLTVIGGDINLSFSQSIEEKKTLSFTVPNLPINSTVTATVKITGDDNIVYYTGSANALIVGDAVPLEIALKYVGPDDDVVDPTPFDPTPVDPEVTLESVDFVTKSESITEEFTFVYEAKATFSDGTFKTTGFTFTSSDESILTIDDTGKATAIKPGNVTITVSYKGKSASIDVEVKAKPVVVSCVGVEFTDKAIELAEGAENIFAARAVMSDGTYVTTGISYESSDDSVIAINSATGATVAKKYGTVTITASYEEFKAEVIVTVLPSIVKVEFVEKLETIVEGETKESAFTAKAILSDDSEITEGLIFTSSDPDVLAIDEDGNVTAGVPGTATIAVSYSGFKDTFDITVLKLNSQGVGVDVTTFKLVATIDMESVYASGDQIAVSGTDEIKFFCFNSTAGEYNYETDRISVDEWTWTINGEMIASGVSDINPQYISLNTEKLNYAGKNIVQCTARKGEHWYEAVFLFTIKQDESTKLAANPIYYDSLTDDSGSLLWLDADSGRSIAITDTPAKNKPVYISTLSDGTTCIVFTGDYKAEDKTKLRCYKLDADGKPVCIKNGSDYFNANLKNPKWFEVDPSSGTSAIGKFAEDPYTGKIWFLGYNYAEDKYYFVGTTSITETVDVKEIEFNVGGSGLKLDYSEKYAYAVCNNYILISHNNMKYDVFHIEDDDTISWLGFTSFNPTGNSSARIVDMQTVKQGDSCYVYTVITASNGDPSYPNSTDIFNEYGCVSRIKYIPTESGIKAFDEETEYAAGLSANTKTERKVYYSRLQYNKYYGPTEEESNSCFYNPVRILAVREDAIFVEDDGFYQKEDSEPGTLTNKDRIMKISLQDKTVSVVKDDITVSLPSSAPSWKYEY